MMNSRLRLLDVNVLIALSVDVHVHHAEAHAALRSIQNGWATCSLTESALVRLLLNPLTTGRNLSVADALAVLGAIREQPGWAFLIDGSSLADAHIDMAALSGAKQVTDFHLVNLAAANDAILLTFDRRIAAVLRGPDLRHVEVIGEIVS